MSKHAFRRQHDFKPLNTSSFQLKSSSSSCITQHSPVKPLSHASMTLVRSSSTLSTNNRQSSPLSTDKPRTVYKYQVIDPQVPYHIAHKWMNDLVLAKTRRDNPEEKDILFIVQHAPVYTLGKGASLQNVMFDTSTTQPFDVQRIERGGEVTYHGPGQLTVYPIINLRNYKQDLHWYVTQLETVVMHTLDTYGISSRIDQEHPGVWVGQNKVAALGCRFSKWVTMHGFALNLTPEVNEGFQRIIPCGIHDRGVTSVQSILDQHHHDKVEAHPHLHASDHHHPPQVDINVVADQIASSFEQVFNVRVIEDDHVNMFYDASLEQAIYEKSHNPDKQKLMLNDIYQGSIDLA